MAMTEAEWLACADPKTMLMFLRGKVSDRKLRLFEVACCRRIWDFIREPQSEAVVEITERSADAPVNVQEVLSLDYDRITDDCGGPDNPERMAFMVAGHVGYSFIGLIHGSPHRTDDWQDALLIAEKSAYTMALSLDRPGDAENLPVFQGRMDTEQAVQCDLLRDIFGNPFRSSPPLPPAVLAWNNGTVRRLAQAIYDDRKMPQGTLDTARLAILADALLDAGCDDEALNQHCRQPGPHVRGCWAIDLILGKQ
jgi:hypothetical protein